MKRVIITTVAFIMLPIVIIAQDSTLNRDVTVERDFQPVINSAGIVQRTPEVIKRYLQPAEVQYSDYSNPLSPTFNINPLGCSLTDFSQNKTYHGYIRSGLGHANTVLDFLCTMQEKKKFNVNLYAHHNAQWGRYATETSMIGMDMNHKWSNSILYFKLNGVNDFVTKSGRYYNDTTEKLDVNKYRDLTPEDKVSMWTINTRIGVRAPEKAMYGYKAEIGYTGFISNAFGAEHQIHTTLGFEWRSKPHKVGIITSIQNNLLKVSLPIPDSLYNNRHYMHIEPYYDYNAKRVHLHIGLNMDMTVGKGSQFSGNENICFNPSPNVHFEYDITKNWMAIYADAVGFLSDASIRSSMLSNPYLAFDKCVRSHHTSPNSPINATIGFKLRPHANLLIDIYGGYAMYNNLVSLTHPMYHDLVDNGYDRATLDIDKFYTDFHQFKVGGEITYHYQDIINILVAANYYKWQVRNFDIRLFPGEELTNNIDLESLNKAAKDVNGNWKALDRPSWDLHVRIDGRINRQWSLYSDNHFAGSREELLFTYRPSSVLGYERDVKYERNNTGATIQLNLGAQYEFNKDLALYAQLNNYIHRHDAKYYGYRDPGANFLIGAYWRF